MNSDILKTVLINSSHNDMRGIRPRILLHSCLRTAIEVIRNNSEFVSY